MELNNQELRDKLYERLEELRLGNGLFVASGKGEFYCKYSWTRDIVMCALPYLKSNPQKYKQTIQSLLDYFIKMEEKHSKLEYLIKNPCPKEKWKYHHPRFFGEDLEEIEDQEWSWLQWDAYGLFLYSIYLGESNGIEIIRDKRDMEIIQQIIKMIDVNKYEETEDGSIWEENLEIHSNSLGMIIRGLRGMKELGFIFDDKVIERGEEVLNNLLPRESVTKDCDLALMTLIYPCNVVSDEMAKTILHNVEEKLLGGYNNRLFGVKRYLKDRYYNVANHKEAKETNRYYDPSLQDGDYENGEPFWAFGLGYLSICWYKLGYIEKAKYYLEQFKGCVDKDGSVPELFYNNTEIRNDNSDLGWSMSMMLLCLQEIEGVI